MPRHPRSVPRIELASTLDASQVFLQSLVMQEVITHAESVDTATVHDAWERSVAALPDSRDEARIVVRDFLLNYGVAEGIIDMLCREHLLEVGDEATSDESPLPEPPKKEEIEQPSKKSSPGRKPNREEVAQAQERLYQLNATIDFTRGRCNGSDEDLFMSDSNAEQSKAAQICASCPIKDDCFDYAVITKQKFGVWGGKTQRELAYIIARQASDESSVA